MFLLARTTGAVAIFWKSGWVGWWSPLHTNINLHLNKKINIENQFQLNAQLYTSKTHLKSTIAGGTKIIFKTPHGLIYWLLGFY